jgi:hypothetical protein
MEVANGDNPLDGSGCGVRSNHRERRCGGTNDPLEAGDGRPLRHRLTVAPPRPLGNASC